MFDGDTRFSCQAKYLAHVTSNIDTDYALYFNHLKKKSEMAYSGKYMQELHHVHKMPNIYRVYRFYRNLWFASERYLIFRFSKDWCLIFFLNMGDLLFEQKIWLKVNFMVLYDISKSNVQYWVFHQNCSKSSKKINFTPTFYPFLDFYGNIMCLWNAKI